MSRYPEHDKLRGIMDKSQAIGEFLEWLGYEKGIQLGSFDDRTDRMWPISGSWQDLAAEWFGIDMRLIEQEKREMLEVQRQLNEDRT